MYQKEFAERMVAKAGSRQYSRLSVMVYYRADCEILEYVPCHAFRPTPKVDSCIVRLKPIGRRFEVKEELFEKVTRALFSHRRKKIKNALLMEGIVSKENIDALPFIEERVEHLTPEEIAELVKKIEEIK